MNKIKYYAFPSAVEDAMSVLLSAKYKAMVMAGGTLVAKSVPDSVETYLDIKRLPIKEIKISGGGLTVGAGATFDEIDSSDACRQWCGGIISKAASKCSSQLIRNMATIGGNIARPHSFNIFPVVLAGLDAYITVMTRSGEKKIPFASLYSSKTLRPGLNCLITSVEFPAPADGMRCEFVKLAKTESSWESYINLFLASGGGKVRIAVGTLSPKPFRAVKTEKAVAGGADPVSAGAVFTEELAAARGSGYRAAAAVNLLERFLGAQI